MANIKDLLTSPPLLTRPKNGEKLYMYLSHSDIAVSVVLVKEIGRRQLQVYFVSKTLTPPAKTRPS